MTKVFRAVLLQLSLHLVVVLYMLVNNTFTLVDNSTIMLAQVSFLSSIMVVTFLLSSLDRHFIDRILSMILRRQSTIKFGIFVLILLSLPYIKNNILMILLGWNREALVALTMPYPLMLLGDITYILVAIILANSGRFSLSFRLVVLSAFLILLITTFSRTTVLNVAFYLVVILLIIPHRIEGKVFRKLLFNFVVLFMVVAILTVLNGRATNILTGLNNSVEAFVRFRTYPYFLSDRLIADDLFVPAYALGGFFFERFLQVVGYLPADYLSILGADYLYEFYFIDGYRANVLYPGWAWFYVSFGWLGLLVQSLINVVIVGLSKYFNLKFTLLYLLVFFIFHSSVSHLYYNAISAVSFIGCVLLDSVILVRLKA